ncbi:SMP protein [Vibrio sp. UCD-FRSSP16_10]|uniref:YtjB family periplasmic protein n=1 Tax=unclassified Vibrio TaxID=2614977 RepID=UPI0007FE3918|nr:MULTISPECIES: AhpA/YtjB family protein [unclassified Vibrio]OBT06603.1 SMP protein [Vibrio sp. UCD-FRSSP16_30]OBT12300.1 SMP protein [Vibrio sp. UCD-FRSSP16_10]
MKESLFSLRLFIKLVFVSLLILMLVSIARNSVYISQGNQQIQTKQLQTLTKLLISQAALSASNFVVTEDQEKLRHLANQLARDTLVADAIIYNNSGVKIASSSNAKTVQESLGMNTPLSSAGIGKQQLVEPIFSQDAIIGYVRITFEKGRVTAFSDHHYRNSDRAMFLMIIMSFFSGVLLTLVLRKKKS